MKAIIHAGMHKTGTTSIQQTFRRIRRPGVHYIDRSRPNHSLLLWTLFEDNPENFSVFQSEGVSRKEILAHRAAWFDDFSRLVRREKYDTVIFSAEAIGTSSEIAVERLADFFRKYCDEIHVIAYVRPPIGYMQSDYQQKLKVRLTKLAPWPKYRERFERLDRIFGRNNVTLRIFDRSLLTAGDVVMDFAKVAGISISPEECVHANEGMSIEALSLLYVQRRHGGGANTGYIGAARVENKMVERLNEIGQGSFYFAPELVAPILERNRDDLEWMERRLGASLRVDIKATGFSIKSEADFESIAIANRDNLERLLLSHIESSGDVPALVRHASAMLKGLEGEISWDGCKAWGREQLKACLALRKDPLQDIVRNINILRLAIAQELGTRTSGFFGRNVNRRMKN